jgi:putative nucleotidyltransferase with HDIG domain
MDTHLQNGGVDQKTNDDLILGSLVGRLRLRDTETLEHSQRVVKLSLILGRKLGLGPTEIKSLKYGSLLHDIGKIGIPDSVLRKPGRLTPAEWNEMRQHPLLGVQMLRDIDFLKGASLIVGQHHERWDAQGYPFGLAGSEIDRNARIFAVADAFDAMTSDRVYHKGRSLEAAAAELNRCAGQQFDPEVVEAFNASRVPLADALRGFANRSVPLMRKATSGSPRFH